jgi:peroxiredoxin
MMALQELHMTRKLALLAAAALAAGCGGSNPPPKKGKPLPAPVQYPSPVPAGGQPSNAETRTGSVGGDPVTPKPVDPPPVTPNPASGAKKGVAPGDDAPELVLEDSNGNVFMLSSYRGKQPVLIVFGATWCGSCKASLPGLKDAAETWTPKGVHVAEIFLGEDKAKASGYASEQGLKYALLPDPRQLSRTKYGFPVADMPMHVLIGKNGKVVASGGRVPTASEFEASLK